MTRREAATRLIRLRTPESLREAMLADPGHPLIQIALAALKAHAAQAEFLREYGVSRLPDDAAVCREAADMLKEQNDIPRATRALDKALRLEPDLRNGRATSNLPSRAARKQKPHQAVVRFSVSRVARGVAARPVSVCDGPVSPLRLFIRAPFDSRGNRFGPRESKGARMRRAVAREKTDNHRFTAGNSLTMSPHSHQRQFEALSSPRSIPRDHHER